MAASLQAGRSKEQNLDCSGIVKGFVIQYYEREDTRSGQNISEVLISKTNSGEGRSSAVVRVGVNK
jgi:hypothetical protein